MLRGDKKRGGNFETAAKEIETRKEPARFCGVFTLQLTWLLDSVAGSLRRVPSALSDYTANFSAGRRRRKMTLLLFCPLPPFFFISRSLPILCLHVMSGGDTYK